MISPTAKNSSSNRERSRIALIIGGILVAIITVLFLAHDGVDSGITSWIPQVTAGNMLVSPSTPGIDAVNLPALLTKLIQF